ncbi:hypothetical protein CDAR_373251 [Caerostris darwini]|uniref:Uncharacterized protein n=1 Tax=Caerostris darwini TaxID=1538125 RepID=A0AAV4XAF5_9ARAC|nr:hypothetical protein CDAR_373251 [Caerostris darwini]
MHVCNYYLRFESTYGLYCSRCILKSRDYANYYLRFESTYGLYCSRCILKSRDYARMQLLSEIRIHLWALLQPLYSEISRLYVCNYYLRFESTYGLYCSRCILKSRDYATTI